MKLRILLALLALLPFLTMAQITLKGRVQDEQTGNPLTGAHLKLNNRLVKTTTDDKGLFVIEGLKPGNYNLKVTFIGYHTWESLVELTENSTMRISVKQAPLFTEEAIITATRANDKTPVAYQNLTGKEISDQDQGRDIPFLLEQMPELWLLPMQEPVWATQDSVSGEPT